MDKYTLLQQYFGHSSFRPGQETLIDALLDGRDVLGVMPTGAGKSMCYQIPALLLSGVTLVVSPLISLMKDQVMALCQAGVPAAYLNSSLSYNQYCEALRRACGGAYKIIYVAPERLTTPGFLHFAENAEISLVAVDEAHCVSHWGQDFRPSYLHIAEFVAQLSRRPAVAAFTATATKEVRADIVRLLQLREPVSVTTGFDRENLFFAVEQPKEKLRRLMELLEERRGRSGIIYCATRANVERVCRSLQDRGFEATRYHAGLDDAERRQNQEDFSYDRKPIMVATNAFGMGIDKSNVSFVIHYNMPKNLESYYQEAGRAGRDGGPADCILLFSNGDIHTAQFLIQNSNENQELSQEDRAALQKRDLARLEEMTAYCRTRFCLRAHILRYFGEHCSDVCGHCGNCQGKFQEIDVTDQAETVLRCIQTVEKRYRTAFHISTYTNLLHGSRDKAVSAFQMTELPVFGSLSQVPLQDIRELLEQLKLQGILAEEQAGPYRHLVLGPAAEEVLRYGQQVRIRQKLQTAPPVQSPQARNVDPKLLAALKALRSRLAAEAQVPAYIIFSNAALEDMAAKAPTDLTAFLRVSGVGTAKAHKYGAEFLATIRAYEARKSAAGPVSESKPDTGARD